MKCRIPEIYRPESIRSELRLCFNTKLFYYIEDAISIVSYRPFRFIWFSEATSPTIYDNTVYMNNALKVLHHEV